MAYSNIWDETAPSDTSLASLLGQDIRTFKLDIRQRLAGISGLSTAMPTPEAVFAGLMYFATDTGHIFVWSGTSWTDLTSIFALAGPPGAPGTPGAPGAPGTPGTPGAPGSPGISQAIDVQAPGNFNIGTGLLNYVIAQVPALSAGHGVRLKLDFEATTTTTCTGSIYYGASSLTSFDMLSGVFSEFNLMFVNLNGTQATQLVSTILLNVNGVEGRPVAFTVALNTTAASTLSLAMISGGGSTSVLVEGWIVELL